MPRNSASPQPPPDLMPLPLPWWGRPKEAAEHYDVGLTTIYTWLNDGRFVTRKLSGVRLVLIGLVRGIDTDEHPPAGAIPVSRRPENAGRRYYGRSRKAA